MLRRQSGIVAVALLAVLFLVPGCKDGVVERLYVLDKQPADVQAEVVRAFGPVERYAEAAGGWVVLSPAQDGNRLVGYVTESRGKFGLAGQRYQVTSAAEAVLKVEGDLAVVETKKSGAPQYVAYRMDADGLKTADYYTERAPEPSVKTGSFVLVNKGLNTLWHYQDGKLVKAYRVATGRQTQPPFPTWNDYKTNFFTPEGLYKVTDFKLNPPYNALKPGDKSFPGGAPGNPLGTRWMGFGVLPGDGAGIWGIHGTAEPEKIGTWASDGCIRMQTQQAEELFEKLKGKNAAIQIVGR